MDYRLIKQGQCDQNGQGKGVNAARMSCNCIRNKELYHPYVTKLPCILQQMHRLNIVQYHKIISVNQQYGQNLLHGENPFMISSNWREKKQNKTKKKKKTNKPTLLKTCQLNQ